MSGSMILLLKYGVLLFSLFSFAALTIQVLRTFSFGKLPLYSQKQGDSKKGIVYAMGKGMMPWEKESAAKHLPTYTAGMLYHTGIFAAFFHVLLLSLSIPLPLWAIHGLQVFMAAGSICGTGLLFKRLLKPHMKSISCPDDFISNLLVDGLILLALFQTFAAAILPILFIWTIIVLLYIPIGKIRHCFFFFYSRILFGSYFGRRGVFPQNQRSFKG